VWRLSPSEDEAGKDGEAGIFAGYVDAAGRRRPMPQPARDATEILKTLSGPSAFLNDHPNDLE
jgi:hypothetical protein